MYEYAGTPTVERNQTPLHEMYESIAKELSYNQDLLNQLNEIAKNVAPIKPKPVDPTDPNSKDEGYLLTLVGKSETILTKVRQHNSFLDGIINHLRNFL